ncbi:MAG: hypothetical protein A3H51_02280 [Candidatus Spechtbacteria bacterium RIFCSPLOWO2_02_FULL_38_8]|uniref:Uncharacterized protein n=1 Tax=Candidatus Spechtbacteria bacterium RIFCSPLOWO2_02_FULL_38_8 TaxID=1802164 RepID=A0A1G2HK52_9BACT|nr:MAG: hypothetical protein A3H51_02280 [Candidatus Spechtbacteria bacterium RIFCSPLOWO2_02_FULL_38_8]
MKKEQPEKQETEHRMGNKRTNREVLLRYVVDTYDDGKEQKWCKGCGGIFFTEQELDKQHSNCDPSNPQGGVEKLLKE